jgi:dCTP deaminase
MATYVEGHSSIGHLGLKVQNAGFFDAGFHGQITLKLENQSGFPIV